MKTTEKFELKSEHVQNLQDEIKKHILRKYGTMSAFGKITKFKRSNLCTILNPVKGNPRIKTLRQIAYISGYLHWF